MCHGDSWGNFMYRKEQNFNQYLHTHKYDYVLVGSVNFYPPSIRNSINLALSMSV